MDDHAFAEDNQFGSVRSDQFPADRHINFIRVVRQNRKVDHRRLFPFGIPHHEIPQSAHGLCTQVTAFDNMIVHNLSEATLFAFSIGTVDIVHQRTENGDIGHLT